MNIKNIGIVYPNGAYSIKYINSHLANNPSRSIYDHIGTSASYGPIKIVDNDTYFIMYYNTIGLSSDKTSNKYGHYFLSDNICSCDIPQHNIIAGPVIFIKYDRDGVSEFKESDIDWILNKVDGIKDSCGLEPYIDNINLNDTSLFGNTFLNYCTEKLAHLFTNR